MEHDLLRLMIKKDKVVVDVFAMRAAVNRKAWVLGSDLNPAVVEALETNVRLNKLQGRNSLCPFNNYHLPSDSTSQYSNCLDISSPNSHQLYPQSFPYSSPFNSASCSLSFYFFSQLYHSLLTHTADNFKSSHPQFNLQSFFLLQISL
ncbi:tRNA(m(1)G37)methyltransferase [Puccinia graminis f. sp. tritici]|uniref:tRNA(M(1)G37)methyltransferase n=1 Tax=Puccinia graminis f. sp. tritici TaxID=56615 RepID=A0A5B0PFT1_PUCGR|nr:tRNA(m(1)G37)methyltransferase [Puccinia graminis f. sp. tritici]